MLPDGWAGPSDRSGVIGDVGNDTEVQNRPQQSVFHFADHAPMAELRIRRALDSRNLRHAEYLAKLRSEYPGECITAQGRNVTSSDSSNENCPNLRQHEQRSRRTGLTTVFQD
jgi:hypothetical protein